MRRLTRPQNHSLDPSTAALYRAAGEKDSRRPQRSCPPCRPRVPTPSRVSEAGSGTAVGAAGSVGRDGSTTLAAVPVTPGRPLALKPAGHVHRAGGDRHPDCAGVARVRPVTMPVAPAARRGQLPTGHREEEPTCQTPLPTSASSSPPAAPGRPWPWPPPRRPARVLSDHWHRPPAEQFALALQAADEALEGLAVELIGGDQGGGQRPAE